MDCEPRPGPAASNGLPGIRLASIADTLAKASQRRDEEVRKALGREREGCSVLIVDKQDCEGRPGGVFDGAYGEEHGLVGQRAMRESSDTETCGSKLAGDEVKGAAAQARHVEEERRQMLDESLKCLMGEMHVREDSSQEAEKRESQQEHKQECGTTSEAVMRVTECDEIPRRDSFQSGLTEVVCKAEAVDQPSSNTSTPLRTAHTAPILDRWLTSGSVWSELDELRDSTHEFVAQEDDEQARYNLRRMLAELNQNSSSTHTKAAVGEDDDPRMMLAELAMLSSSVMPNDGSSIISISDGEEDEDIKHIRARLEQLRSPSDPPSLLSPSSTVLATTTTSSIPSTDAPRELLVDTVAPRLEHSALPWSPSRSNPEILLDSDPATQLAPYTNSNHNLDLALDRTCAIAHTEAKLQAIVASEFQIERALRASAEATLLQRRLVVSNLAVGVDEEEIERQFWSVRWDILKVSLLPRDPQSRTRTAWVDFTSREAAVRASWVTGHVYGLIFSVQLAIPVGEE